MTAVMTGPAGQEAGRCRGIWRGREGFGHRLAELPPPRGDTPGTVGYQLVDHR